MSREKKLYEPEFPGYGGERVVNNEVAFLQLENKRLNDQLNLSTTQNGLYLYENDQLNKRVYDLQNELHNLRTSCETDANNLTRCNNEVLRLRNELAPRVPLVTSRSQRPRNN